MTQVNYLAVVVAAAAAVVAASVWYIVFGDQLVELGSAAGDVGRSPALVMPVEPVRSLVLAAVLAGLAAQLGIATWTGAVKLGLALWFGFPVVLLLGSVFHENVPWRIAAIHAGDWLMKLLVIAVIVSVWRRRFVLVRDAGEWEDGVLSDDHDQPAR